MSTESLALGRLDTLTPEQHEILSQFKIQLGDEGFYDPTAHDDHLLLRFLRARKFDLEASKKMWIDKEKWALEYGVKDLMNSIDFPEYPVVKNYYPRYYHKTDKLGRPIYIEHIGALDVTKLLNVTTVERMLRHHVYEYEKLGRYRLPACSAKAGKYLEQSCTILDFNGAQIMQFTSNYSIMQQVSSLAQNYYPETLGKMYCFLCQVY